MSDEKGHELWRDCIRWLLDVGVIPRNHKIAQPDATMLDLAAILRDGVLLCHLVNAIVPNSVDMREIPSQMHHLSEFQCQKIICLFLNACKIVFNLKDDDMFLAWELFKMIDFVKVLRTLSVISQSEICKSLRFQPFPRETDLINLEEEEEIYKNLQEDVEAVDVEDHYDYNNYRNIAQEEDKIYDHFVVRQDSKREWKNEEWAAFVPSTKRDHAIKELLDTEQNYAEKALDMIMNKFYAPLKRHFLDQNDHAIVFMNIADLSILHSKFYQDLQKAVFRTCGINQQDSRPPSSLMRFIGDVFLHHKDKFIAYGKYCMSLDRSRDKLTLIEKSDPQLWARIQECTSAVNNNQFKLQDLLCLPMQRVLKYHLLLSELLKHTSVDSHDRNSLEQAKDAMNDINSYINEMKRDFENQQLIKQVEQSIVDLVMPENTSLLDYGRLHTDCEVKLSESTEKSVGKLKNRHIFLFDKVLFICQSKRSTSYVYKGAYLVHQLTVDEEHVENRFGTIRKLASGSQHLLHLVIDIPEERCASTPNDDPVRYITLAFKVRGLMEKWLKQFQLSKDNVYPLMARQHRHKIKFKSFDISTAHRCSYCQKLLKGVMYQGYQCESCNLMFHKGCINRPCAGKRQTSITPTASFTMGQEPRRRPFEQIRPGEQVVSTTPYFSNDSLYLNFDKDEIIECTGHVSEELFKGKLLKDRTLIGLVRYGNVKRIRAHSSVGHIFATENNGISRKESTVLPRRPAPTPIINNCHSNYINTDVETQTWYYGNTARGDAERMLQHSADGTFLVRFSPAQNKYAISISFKGNVKHTIVEQDEHGQYFYDEVIKFNSIVELVNYFAKNSLSQCFEQLNTYLLYPYRETKQYRAIHDFNGTEAKFLRLYKDEIVTLLDTIGEDKGWWKGKLVRNGVEEIGFFPLAYVEPIE